LQVYVYKRTTMRKVLPLFGFVISLIPLFSQPFLKPSIGLTTKPQLQDSICKINNYLGSFEMSGYQVQDTVHDFTLYEPNGTPQTLSQDLRNGKPVLLISSSYTCPVFRGKIDEINALHAMFKDRVRIYVVYTVEAHPNQDISPYFGRVNTGQQNMNEGVLYRQPLTYGDRLNVVNDLLLNYPLDVPILVDGPCNAWWTQYGPAPNNATLIDTNGVVRIKHAWFDRDPDDMFCDLRQWLDPKDPCDSVAQGKSAFRFTINSDTVVRTQTNGFAYVSATLQNIGNYPMKIEVRRLLNQLPAGWSSSMCLDVCYPSDVDSTLINLDPQQTMDLIVDVFTGPDPDTGSIRIGMRNADDVMNRAIIRISVISEQPTGNKFVEQDPILVYPNPASQALFIQSEVYGCFQLIHEGGKIYREGKLDRRIQLDCGDAIPGIYFLKLFDEENPPVLRKLLITR